MFARVGAHVLLILWNDYLYVPSAFCFQRNNSKYSLFIVVVMDTSGQSTVGPSVPPPSMASSRSSAHTGGAVTRSVLLSVHNEYMTKLSEEMRAYREITVPAFLAQSGRKLEDPDTDAFMESSVRAYAHVLEQSYGGPDSDWRKERLAIKLCRT